MRCLVCCLVFSLKGEENQGDNRPLEIRVWIRGEITYRIPGGPL
jgi:hypothetical protein